MQKYHIRDYTLIARAFSSAFYIKRGYMRFFVILQQIAEDLYAKCKMQNYRGSYASDCIDKVSVGGIPAFEGGGTTFLFS